MEEDTTAARRGGHRGEANQAKIGGQNPALAEEIHGAKSGARRVGILENNLVVLLLVSVHLQRRVRCLRWLRMVGVGGGGGG